MTSNIRDVARRAQVSLGTVSNALNRPEVVSPKTLQKVQLAITELGFVYRSNSRTEKSQHSKTIALLVPSMSNIFYAEISQGVEDCAAKYGYTVLLANHDDSIDREDHHLSLFSNHGIAGVLVRPASDRDVDLTDLYPNLSIINLMDNAPPSRDHCSATVDGELGGELAIQHLADLGHRNLVYVSGPSSIPQFSARGAGAYKMAHKLSVSLRTVEVDGSSAKHGEEAANLILASGNLPTAIFCGNDMLALGVLRKLILAQLKVPDDISVMGFDDIEFAASANVPLTTIAQSTYQLGYIAAELLIQECENSVLHAHQQIIFQPQLVARKSTAALKQS